MSASIAYDGATLPNGLTLDDSLKAVLQAFQQSGLEGSHPNNTGGFQGGDMFSGSSYSYADSELGFAFKAEGDLHYYFPPISGPSQGDNIPAHTLWGEIDSITLGGGLNGNGSEVIDPLFTIDFSTPIEGALDEGRANDVHDIVYGLMNGSVEGYGDDNHGGLLAALQDQGVNLDASVADVVGIAAQDVAA
ncbi:heme acquisition protein HasA [Carnimonas bestiolae]|uniref:heme acquisition protein HasA n=1 Tax=Carnimonas bestiolae TaxID=3402172 RepID=UPI003EDBBC71